MPQTNIRTGEYTPLGRNIADAGPYITLNTEPPPDEGGVDLFGSGAGYRPGRNSYSIDGLTVPEDDFRRAIDSGAIGGAFGLLQISAQMSAPRYTVYDRWGDEAYSGTDWAATRTAAYQTETLTAYRTLNESWSVLLSIIPQTQRQTTDGSGEDKTVINALKKFLGAKKYSRCKDAVMAVAKTLGIPKIDDFIKNLKFYDMTQPGMLDKKGLLANPDDTFRDLINRTPNWQDPIAGATKDTDNIFLFRDYYATELYYSKTGDLKLTTIPKRN